MQLIAVPKGKIFIFIGEGFLAKNKIFKAGELITQSQLKNGFFVSGTKESLIFCWV